MEEQISPDWRDLERLYTLIRSRKCQTVLEFGVGYSTGRIANALVENKNEWDKIKDKPPVRNRFMFHSFCVDASKYWLQHAESKLPDHLLSTVTFQYSPVQIAQWNGQVCSFYNQLPDVVPDFIYLDAPDPRQVEGDIHGLTFSDCPERTVMAGDILLMESTLLPGCCILVDGRTNNARFLERNFTRNWGIIWDKKCDITIFVLNEESLGKYNPIVETV